MKQITAIIADDEETLRVYLRKMLAGAWPELLIVGEADDGESALRAVEEQKPDLAFLDIQMPGMSGIEVAKKIAQTCAIVFITAYNKYAVEAFENEAIDYLLKPVAEERLKRTVKRLKERINSSSARVPDVPAVLAKMTGVIRKPSEYLQWIKARHRDGVRLIPVSDIYYFKATDKYTSVRTKDGEFLIRTTIKDLEGELDGSHFWRVHRGVIVNAKAIYTVAHSLGRTSTIKFRDIPDSLSVSRAFTYLFREM